MLADKRKAHHFEAHAVVEQMVVALEWILWRHDKPYLVELGKAEQPASKLDVTVVYGVE